MAAPKCEGYKTIGDRPECTAYNTYTCPVENSAINGTCDNRHGGKKCFTGNGYFYNAQNCQEVPSEAYVDPGGEPQIHDQVGSKEWPAHSWNGKWRICPEGWAVVGRLNAHGSRYNVKCKKMVPNAMDEGGSTMQSTNWNGPSWGSGPVGADSYTKVELCPAGQVATKLLENDMGCRRVKPGQASFIEEMSKSSD